MRFSVIMPCHNSAERIRKPLDSIRGQTLTDYELIVVCDACDDNTKEIAESYGAITLEVDYRTPGLTKNAGIDIARGEYILFMNDDDYYLHERVFEMLSAQLTINEPDVMCFGFIMGYLGYRKALGNNGALFPGDTLKAWKRQAIGGTRFNEQTVTHDLDFLRAMSKKNLTFNIWDEPLYYHDYMRPGSITETNRR